ncbi:N-acyl-D-amino-acid deacylase family protein [Flavisphingomonas formosensis]|uniref:N-acyl-D-amino-acid deacylase family protein n=1 Tax=Flavisphingomonas formosensis TaxID=861534 RepID=UPI0012F78D2C|nr:amidohydrolase family protein [Sphingomonas formosensis]
MVAETGKFLIKGGKLVDGTGAPATMADVRVADGLIAEVGPGLAAQPGERVVDASGCVVTPGFIEPHTHYDGIMWWQPDLDPLPGHGISTIVMGDCGFTCAPLSHDPEVRMEMIKIFSFFEDIPIQPFLDNVAWDWNSWSEYKASMERNLKLPVNYSAYVGHLALRFAVMGLEAWERVATPDEIAKMAAMLDDGMKAGALGLSTNLLDLDGQNRPVPTLLSDDAEFAALIDVLDRYPNAQMEIALDIFLRMTGLEQMERIARLTKGKKVRVQWGGLPTLEFQKAMGTQQPLEQFHERMKAEGRDFWTAFAHVSPTLTISVQHSLVWAQSGSMAWNEVVEAQGDEAKAKLLRDPEWRARARKSLDEDVYRQSNMANPDKLIFLASDNGHGPVKVTVGEVARERGVHYSDAMADWFLDNGLESAIHLEGWTQDDEMVVKLYKDDFAVGNINDTGAHGQMFCGVGQNMMLFTEFHKKGLLTLEEAVHAITGRPARHFGLADRGEIRVGKRADVAVFNLDEIEVADWERVYDVPEADGRKTWRWTRSAAPTRLTLVNGVVTFENGEATGARPGTFVAPSQEETVVLEAAE